MRSRGVFEFRTRPSDFGRIGGSIRLMAERGETFLLGKNVPETMVATNASYSYELYKISRRVFNAPMDCRWDCEFQRNISRLTYAGMKAMYRKVSKTCGLSSYVAVAKRRNDNDSIVDYAQRIFEASGQENVSVWTFLLCEEKESVLYVRRFFLEGFSSGLDILNVVKIQKRIREERKRDLPKNN